MTNHRDEFLELHAHGDEKYLELTVVQARERLYARVAVARGGERYLALLLHELVSRGQVDVRVVQHWFEICGKGDGPKVERR